MEKHVVNADGKCEEVVSILYFEYDIIQIKDVSEPHTMIKFIKNINKIITRTLLTQFEPQFRQF